MQSVKTNLKLLQERLEWDNKQTEANVLRKAHKLIVELEEELKYVQGCLSAVTTGNMPEPCDFNQMMHAMQGRKFAKMLQEKDKNVILVGEAE